MVFDFAAKHVEKAHRNHVGLGACVPERVFVLQGVEMKELRFDVFGQLVAVAGRQGSWSAYILGPDGKRREADFIVPNFLAEDELCQYLADLFHESATPWNGSVKPIAGPDEPGRWQPPES